MELCHFDFLVPAINTFSELSSSKLSRFSQCAKHLADFSVLRGIFSPGNMVSMYLEASGDVLDLVNLHYLTQPGCRWQDVRWMANILSSNVCVQESDLVFLFISRCSSSNGGFLHPPPSKKKMTANLRRGMEICLHLTYFFLSEMFHCYKTGIYFDWILKLVQRLQPVLSVRAITYPPLQSSLWTSTDTTLMQ